MSDSDRLAKLEAELAEIKEALRNCRNGTRFHYGITTREFAKLCGITAHQLSQWTEEKITREPDFRD